MSSLLPPGLLVVSPVRWLREMLAAHLALSPGVRLIAATGTVVEALETLLTERPDLILLDPALPNGPACVRALQSAAATARVIVLDLAGAGPSVVEWLAAGAAGRLEANLPLHQIGESLRAAAIAHRARVIEGEVDARTVTAREREVILLAAAGLCNKEIARHLGIGLPTAKSHVHNVLTKLNLQRRSQLAEWLRRPPSVTVRPPTSEAAP